MDPATIAMIASIVGPALAGLGGKNEKHGSTYSKGQRGFLDQLLNSVKGMQGSQDISKQPGYQTGQNWLQSMFSDPDFFNKFEAPLQRQFQEQTIPGLAERFGGGSGNALGSTAFRRQLGREAGNLSANLGALRGGMQQQAIPQLLGYSQQPFQNYMSLLQSALTPTNNTYQPASSGFFGPISSAFAGGAAQGYGQNWGQNMAGQNPSTSPSGNGFVAGWDNQFRQQGVSMF